MANHKRYSAEEKVRILREHLENNKSVSQLAEEYGISPKMIYQWRKKLFEGALETFKNNTKKSKQIKTLEQKLQDRDSLISEIVSENIRFKKNSNGAL